MMDAVAIFGSQVSGGSDARSDQDLLIVCDLNEKNRKIRKYSKQGYSVSAYSPKQLYLMKKHGSLFLQHLKTESKILHDSNNLFGKFISKCEFSPPQNKEMCRCISSIINAMRCPDTDKLSWWQSDYLFVLSRDYFVKYFAQSGRLIFNTKKLYNEIRNEFNLSRTDADLFLELRKAKSIYRSKEPICSSNLSVIDKWNVVLSKIINCAIPTRYSVDSYVNCRDLNSFESTYELLRYVESLKIAFPHIRCSNMNEFIVNKLIINPNHYSSTSIKGKAFLLSYLIEFRIQANKYINKDFHSRVWFFSPILETMVSRYKYQSG